MINAVKEINTTKDDMKVSGDTLGREGVSSIFTPNFLVASAGSLCDHGAGMCNI